MDEQALNDLLGAWRVHNRITLLLIGAIPAKGFAAVPAGSKGRTVAEQFDHMHRIRLGWLAYHRTGRRVTAKEVRLTVMTRASLKKAFTASGKEVERFFGELAAGSSRLRAFRSNPVRFAGYLIAHESHHRGSIMLALKQNGLRLPETVALKGLWQSWMWDGR